MPSFKDLPEVPIIAVNGGWSVHARTLCGGGRRVLGLGGWLHVAKISANASTRRA